MKGETRNKHTHKDTTGQRTWENGEREGGYTERMNRPIRTRKEKTIEVETPVKAAVQHDIPRRQRVFRIFNLPFFQGRRKKRLLQVQKFKPARNKTPTNRE